MMPVSERDAENARLEAIEEEAADWMVRLSGVRLTADEHREFNSWLRSSDDHARVFAFARQTWQDIAKVDIPLPTETVPDEVRVVRKSASGNKPRIPIALAASLAVAVAGVALAKAPWIALQADHYTTVGEVKSVTLPDGSIAALDTDSAIAVDYLESVRRIRLLRGTAQFTVARVDDPERRPFVVDAAGGNVRALGTRFVVSFADDAATVGVIEHSVAVSMTTGVADTEVVTEGRSVRYDSSQGIVASDARPTATWEQGYLLFDDVPLRDALAQLDRYLPGRLLILDGSLADRRVSGRFRIDELEGGIDAIAHELGARTATLPGVMIAFY